MTPEEALREMAEGPYEELYEIRELDGRLYAAPIDPDSDFHLTWDGKEWSLTDGLAPSPPNSGRWWRSVRIGALRFGVRLPVLIPTAALERWREGMASGWYLREHAERDLGLDHLIPTLQETISIKEQCSRHHEPKLNDRCPVEGCKEH